MNVDNDSYAVDRDGRFVALGSPFRTGDHMHFLAQAGEVCDWCHKIQGAELIATGAEVTS